MPVIDRARDHDKALLAKRCPSGRRDARHAFNSSSRVG
jgi:hypothetical protein